MKKEDHTKHNLKEPEKMSRREALKKAGIYAVFTAASMLVILSPKESQAGSDLPEEPCGTWGE